MSNKTTSSSTGNPCDTIGKLQDKLRKLKAQLEYATQNYNDRTATLQTELDNERTAKRQLTRDQKKAVKAVRDEETKKCQCLLEQIRAQLTLKFKEDLEKERQRLTDKYQVKKKSTATDTGNRFSRLFKVGDATAAKSKTSHVKDLVRRLNGLQTGPSSSTSGKQSNKCVTKTPNSCLTTISNTNNNQSSHTKSSTLMSTDSQTPSCRPDSADTESVTEEPIVPQIIVPNQDCNDSILPNDSLTEDGAMDDRNSVINSWTKGVGVETLYTLLSNAHLELQRAHLILQSNLRKEQRMRKHLDDKVRHLNALLLTHKSKQHLLINPINSSLAQQLDDCKERESKLLEQLQELNDQNELLEFRVLELEQCTGVEHTLTKRAVSRTPDTDISDSGVISLSPSEDIYCSDTDLHDISSKLEPSTSSMGGDVKERLSLLCQNLDNVSERIIVQQAINLLRHYESRISGMEATVSNMCQEVAMCRSMSCIEDTPPPPPLSATPSPPIDRKASTHRIIATVLPFSGHPSSSPEQINFQYSSSPSEDYSQYSAQHSHYPLENLSSGAHSQYSSGENQSIAPHPHSLTSQSNILTNQSSNSLTNHSSHSSSLTSHDRTPTSNSSNPSHSSPLPPNSHPSYPTSLPSTHLEEEMDGEGMDEDLMTIESPFRKLFRGDDSMQESGIYFEDEDLGFHCQSTQTDAANQSRLSEELRKLAQIRQKLEQEQGREKYFKPIQQDKSKIMCSRQELEYYKEEMERLERRLQLYESCGEEQNCRLKEMLERDEVLKKQLMRLEEDNLKLRRENEFLDMEKCEYEELENDTRLQYQRLEVQLNSINEKKHELQTQLSQNIRLIHNLKSNIETNDKIKAEAQTRLEEAESRIASLDTTLSCYEATLNKCEQKNFELEEKEIEMKYRIYLLENILPVLISFHLYRLVERSRAYWTTRRISCKNSNETLAISCDTSSTNSPVQPVFPACPTVDRLENSNENNPKRIEDDDLLTESNPNLTTSHVETFIETCHIQTQTDDIACNNESDEIRDSIVQSDENNLETNTHKLVINRRISLTESESHEQSIYCENCTNNNNTSVLNNDKIEELDRMIADLKIKEKLYEQTMSEADEMFSNMTLEYRVQIENLENQLNATSIELKSMKRELEKEREENDRVTNGSVDLMKQIKVKEGEKKQLNNMLDCLRLQLEEEREESLKFKQEISSFKKLFETEKSKCKELEIDLKEANSEIKDLESRVENKMKSYEKEIDKLCKKLEDMAVTNGELKEEVDTLENVVKELRVALNHERYKRDTLKTEMSDELQAKAQELSDLRRTIQGMGLKSTAQEIEEALASMEQQGEEDGCHLSITEIPDQLERLTEKLADSQDHTKTCESCKTNLSAIVQDLMDQISCIKTSRMCQGPHSTEPLSLTSSKDLSFITPNTSTPSSLLEMKCREKDTLIFNLAFELKQLADRNLWVRYPALVDNLRKTISHCPDFTRAVLVQYLNGKLAVTPKFSDKSPLDLKIIKAVGSNSLLIVWKPPPPHCNVLEFLVYINGAYLRNIYAEQGRALLHPVDIQQISKPIQVTLMSADAKYPSASAYYC
uniref:Uncharacterized protein n=1 Tax=Cacopsylla melanoneura TaxID=428564 RepID=A0A8D9F982_9HEMI